MTFTIMAMALLLLCWVSLCWMPFMMNVWNMHFMLRVIMLNIVMLNVLMLNVLMLNVIMLSVVAPKYRAETKRSSLFYKSILTMKKSFLNIATRKLLRFNKTRCPFHKHLYTCKLANPGTVIWRGRLSTIDLLIKIGCFVKKEKI